MAYILNIDSSLEIASICISKDGVLIHYVENEKQRDHAAWLQPGVQQLLAECGLQLKDIHAVAISNGPGSYTGLRIGLSTAKGLCYALSIPLIAINTLDMMAAAVQEDVDFICPMIDARRMEVYTALYNKSGTRIIEPVAMIINEKSFADILESNTILFFGSGSLKLKPFVCNTKGLFKEIKSSAKNLVAIAQSRFYIRDFVNVLHIQPTYIKEFNSYVK